MDRAYVLQYIDGQLDSLARRPGMWGPALAIELQALLLLEFRSVMLRPGFDAENPRAVRDALASFVAEKFPDGAGVPLARALATAGREHELPVLLAEFRARLVADMHADNPFETNDLAVVLRLKKDVARPSASSVGGYIEDLRRALRGILRTKAQGRMAKELEVATDFGLSDVVVVPSNGVPGRVVLPLTYRAPEQLSSPAVVKVPEEEIRDALAHVAATVAWADRDAPVAELAEVLTDATRREKVAAQTLRLMPRGVDVEAVEIGGRLVARAEPMRLTRDQKPRVKQVRVEGFASTNIEETGNVRQLDLDDGTFRLGQPNSKDRVKCVLSDWDLLAAAQEALGGRATVIGRRVQPNLGKPFIWVESIRVDDDADHDDDDDVN